MGRSNTTTETKHDSDTSLNKLTPEKMDMFLLPGVVKSRRLSLNKIVKLEQLADNNLILFPITKMKNGIETSGWMWDIYGNVLKNTCCVMQEILSQTHLNVRGSMYKYKRQSHDMNKQIRFGIKYQVSSIMALNCINVSYLVFQIKLFMVTRKEIGT